MEEEGNRCPQAGRLADAVGRVAEGQVGVQDPQWEGGGGWSHRSNTLNSLSLVHLPHLLHIYIYTMCRSTDLWSNTAHTRFILFFLKQLKRTLLTNYFCFSLLKIQKHHVCNKCLMKKNKKLAITKRSYQLTATSHQ